MPQVSRSPIAKRLASVNMIASGTALVLACLLLAVYDFVSFRRSMLDNRTVQAQIVGLNTISALTFDDPETAESTLAALRAAPHVEAAGLYRPDGELFATYRRTPDVVPLALPKASADQLEWHNYDGLRTLHVVRRIVQDGAPIGLVYIRSDLQELRDRLAGYALLVVGVLAIAIIAAGIVSRAATRSIAGPIISLAALASRLSTDRDYSVRASVEGQGELAVLVSAFNEMLAQIQARDRSLQDSHALLEERVQERTRALDASNKELEAFCYSVSHDLRSPLRSIDGFSQALTEDLGAGLDEASAQHLARIRAAAKRMGTLIDDLLGLSRISRTELTRRSVDLSGLAQAALAECAASDPDRRVEVVIADGLSAMGDPRLLRQVFDNLIRNAWKFTSKQGEARLEFGARQQEGGTVYFVKDNGAGFDPAYAPRLFGVFQRLHSMTEFPGTGVGLAIVERIIARHNGRIWAESAVGQGATFYFTLGSAPTPSRDAA